jgi:hypothetical protein
MTVIPVTPKDHFLRLVQNKAPNWIGDPFRCFNCDARTGLPYLLDATALAHQRTGKGGVGVPDAWGVVWDWPEEQPGPVPNHFGDNIVVKDITRWREFFDFPDLDGLDWASTDTLCKTLDRDTRLVMAQSPRGMFEFSHAMLGFQEALENYLLEPDDMYDMLSAYTDWKIKATGLCIDHMAPDIIVNFDDWGAKTQLLLPPRTWRAILKPLYKKFYDYIHSRGVLVMHHCDSYAQDICEDMVEIGVDIWQGVTPENDILSIVQKTGGKLVMFGGIDMPSIDYPEVREDTIRAHVRATIDRYAPTGRYLPIFTSWLPINSSVRGVACDEMDRYGEKIYKV